MEYCSIVWDPYHINKIKQVEIIQKKFLKFLGRKYHRLDLRLVQNYDLLDLYKIDSLQKRRKIANILYLYRILNNLENNNFVLSKLNFNIPRVNSRSLHLFYQPPFRINISRNPQ